MFIIATTSFILLFCAGLIYADFVVFKLPHKNISIDRLIQSIKNVNEKDC